MFLASFSGVHPAATSDGPSAGSSATHDAGTSTSHSSKSAITSGSMRAAVLTTPFSVFDAIPVRTANAPSTLRDSAADASRRRYAGWISCMTRVWIPG
jgi:hypothetical protein